ncbi:MAG: hypothetical protein F4196_10840 [Acidimicrobiia bacterium]|nr:hypothetical protein [Acidimicrobiia bacterium]
MRDRPTRLLPGKIGHASGDGHFPGACPRSHRLTPAIEPVTFDFSLELDSEGWGVGFADLPADYDPSIYELDSGHGALPGGLHGAGIYVQGHNRSDDLFMYLKRRVDGLAPGASYEVAVTVDLATNVGAGLIGIGGSPGGSVFVKAGASTVEPATMIDATGHSG